MLLWLYYQQAFFPRALSFVCQSLLVWSVWSGADPTKGLARSHISAIRHVTARAGLQRFTPLTLEQPIHLFPSSLLHFKLWVVPPVWGMSTQKDWSKPFQIIRLLILWLNKPYIFQILNQYSIFSLYSVTVCIFQSALSCPSR